MGNKVSEDTFSFQDKAPQKTFCPLVILSAKNLTALSCSRCELEHWVTGRSAVVSALRFLRGCWQHSCNLSTPEPKARGTWTKS